MTFSIAARDPDSGDFGVAVQSKFPAVGSVVPWVRGGVGAIATQAWANLSYGPDGLGFLEESLDAASVVKRLTTPDEQREHRQLGVVDREGRAAAFTGSSCMDWAGHKSGEGYTCQGNILAGPAVVEAMAAVYETTDALFPERLVAALQGGQREGGDRRGQQAAALYVARVGGGYGGWLDRYIDLRVDDHRAPIDELERLLKMHRLYFRDAGEETEFVEVDTATTNEIAMMLSRLGYLASAGARSMGEMRDELNAWASTENLEERMTEGELIDPVVLDYMREQVAKG